MEQVHPGPLSQTESLYSPLENAVGGKKGIKLR